MQGTHWKDQLADRGDKSTGEWLSRVKDDARRGGCGNGGGAQPGAQPRAQLPPIQIDDLGAKLSFDLRMIGWARIIHQRITWLALLVWLARLPIRLPLRGAFWIGRQWLKWRIRRYAERGPVAPGSLVGKRRQACEACDKIEGHILKYCGACQCGKRSVRNSLDRKWTLANYRCPLGRWPGETYPKWLAFAYRVLNEACPSCQAGAPPPPKPRTDPDGGIPVPPEIVRKLFRKETPFTVSSRRP